jgi:hypothetical protein
MEHGSTQCELLLLQETTVLEKKKLAVRMELDLAGHPLRNLYNDSKHRKRMTDSDVPSPVCLAHKNSNQVAHAPPATQCPLTPHPSAISPSSHHLVALHFLTSTPSVLPPSLFKSGELGKAEYLVLRLARETQTARRYS